MHPIREPHRWRSERPPGARTLFFSGDLMAPMMGTLPARRRGCQWQPPQRREDPSPRHSPNPSAGALPRPDILQGGFSFPRCDILQGGLCLPRPDTLQGSLCLLRCDILQGGLCFLSLVPHKMFYSSPVKVWKTKLPSSAWGLPWVPNRGQRLLATAPTWLPASGNTDPLGASLGIILGIALGPDLRSHLRILRSALSRPQEAML